MRRVLFVMATGVLGVLVPGLPSGASDPERRGPVLRWPSPPYRTLQEAIDAAPDGSTIDLHEGTYDLAEPLRVSGKRLTIQGAGSGIPDQHGRVKKFTHLRGPRGTRAADPERAQGGISYVGAGGVLRDLRISGFNVGLTARSDDRGSAFPLTVRDAALSDGGDGIIWFAPAELTIQDVDLSKFAGNGLWVVNGKLKAFGVTIAEVDDIGLFLTAPVDGGVPTENIILAANINLATVGIVVFQSAAMIFSSKVALCGGGGIWAIYAEVLGLFNWVAANGTVGIGAINAAVTLIGNEVLDTIYTLIGGEESWGDGIAFVADDFPSLGTLVGNTVSNSYRAGVSNFGSVVYLQANAVDNSAFALEGEAYKGYPFDFIDGGFNTTDGGPISPYVSAGLAPPEPGVPVN